MKDYRMDDSKKEQIRCIQYWWIERGDIERWSGWDNAKKDFLAIDALLEIKKYLNKTIDHVVRTLGEKNELS